MVPNIFHFVFGMAADFGGKPFALSHYLSIKSAVEINKPITTYFHYQFEPEGEWWEKAKRLVTLNKIEAPDSFMGNKLYHVAHKADVIRLQMLKEHGGIYLDLDTICVKSMIDLFNCSFAIGQELKAPYTPKNWRQKIKLSFRNKFNTPTNNDTPATGLCNAVLLSAKNSEFVIKWLNEYKSFRSKGRDKYWNEHSVKIPQTLSEKFPDAISKLSPYAFHYPLYDMAGLSAMFESITEFPDAYLHHLWDSFSGEKYLSKLTVDEIKKVDTTYNLIARRFL